MNILTIDTATDYEFISVTTDHGTFEFAENVKLSHSVTMFKSINDILNKASITQQDINLIGAGIGPGSFTGVRIAVSTARMMAQILDIPLIGLTTQDIFASSVQNESDEKILVAFDAKKSRVFGALYQGGTELEHKIIIDAGDYSIDYILKNLSKGDKLLCIGDGCSRYNDTISNFADSLCFSYRILEKYIPSGLITSRLVSTKYNSCPDKYAFYGNTIPFYARKSDAEIALDEKKAGNA